MHLILHYVDCHIGVELLQTMHVCYKHRDQFDQKM